MADEIVLIDQITTSDDESDKRENQLYLRVTVEETSEVSFPVSKPLNLVLEERMNQTYAMCNLSLEDPIGSLVNIKPIEGDFLFRVYIGSDIESARTYKMKLNKIEMNNLSIGESGNYVINLSLVSDNWQTLIHDKRSKAWRNVRYSDVAKEIAEEAGFDQLLINDSKEEKRHVISPFWTNQKVIRYCAEEAQPKESDSFFVFGALSDDRFYFCPFTDLYDDLIKDTFQTDTNDHPRKFILSGDVLPEYQTDEKIKILDFQVCSNYAEELRKGASGVRYGYYSYVDGEYVTGEKKFSESDERQLSDWSYLSENQETIGSFYNGNRDVETPSIAMKQVSKETNNLQRVNITINGQTEIEVGERVKILIPINPDLVETLYNEFYSGYYIISTKRTICNLENSKARTVFGLTRQGINGDVNTLTQSQTGKDV